MRLIDVDAANVDSIQCYYGSNCHVEDVEEWLKDQPTIDAVPVVHGRWEKLGEADYKCSVCGFRFTSGDPIELFTHCRCGAKMDLEE